MLGLCTYTFVGGQALEVENPYSRYDIVEPLVANSLWVVAWPSDPIAPGA